MKKSRKTILWTILISCLLIFSTGSLYAADCASAAIKRVGSNPANGSTGASPYMVQLDCSNDNIWAGTVTYYLSEDLGDSGLATLLTAYSLGKTVWVRTLGTTAGSIISVIYVND